MTVVPRNSGTVILTAVGFQYVAADALPKVPYLTRIDIWVMAQMLLVLASFFENLLIFFLNHPVQAFDCRASAPLGPRYGLADAEWSPTFPCSGLQERMAAELVRLDQLLAVAYLGLELAILLWFLAPLWWPGHGGGGRKNAATTAGGDEGPAGPVGRTKVD